VLDAVTRHLSGDVENPKGDFSIEYFGWVMLPVVSV
jgi:hypothetical protein